MSLDSTSDLSRNELNLYRDYFLKTWVERIQTYAARPSILGAVHPENIVGAHDYELVVEGCRMGNVVYSYENYNLYLREYVAYLDVCETLNVPIYPSKEYFLKHLYTNGEDGFLNLRPCVDDPIVLFDGKAEHTVTHHYMHFSKMINGNRYGDAGENFVTRHFVNGVASYYKGRGYSLSDFENHEPLSVMTTSHLTDEDFAKIFCPSLGKKRIKEHVTPHADYKNFISGLSKARTNGKAKDLTRFITDARRSKELSKLGNDNSVKTIYLIDDSNDEVITTAPMITKIPLLFRELLDGAERIRLDMSGEDVEFEVVNISIDGCVSVVKVHLNRVEEF